MSVDVELEKILKHAMAAPPLHALSVADSRETFRRLTRERTALAPAMPTTDITVDGAAGPLPARLYEPDGAAGGDLLVYFHGGGFVLGDLDTHDPLCRRLAAAAPIRVLSVAYRVGPEDAYPAAYEDGLAALAWAAGQLPRGARLHLGGDSAGANIAARTATRAASSGVRLDGLLLIYPNVAFACRTASRVACGEGYMLGQEDLDYFAGHFLQGAEDSSLLDETFDGLPQTIIVTAGYDPLCDEGCALAERMRRSGVAVREMHWPSLIHGFANMCHLSSAAEAAVRDIGAAVGSLNRVGA